MAEISAAFKDIVDLSMSVDMMSVPAVKPVLPTTGSPTPKVAPGPPPSPVTINPSAPTTGPKSLNTSPNRPPSVPGANHAVGSAMNLSLVPPSQPLIPRSPDKSKDFPVSMKPTANGVEESQSIEMKNKEEPSGIHNHTSNATGTPVMMSSPVPAVAISPVLADLTDSSSQAQAGSTKPEASSPLPNTTSNHSASANNLADEPVKETAAVPDHSPQQIQQQANQVPEQPQEQPPPQSPVEEAQKQSPTANNSSAPVSTASPLPNATSVSPSNPSAPEVPSKPVTASADTTKLRPDVPKPEFKVATPPRTVKRKREVKPAAEKPASSNEDNENKKVKRVRTRTQPYQSPLPEMNYINKLKTIIKSPDDKLIVFYKNEFLAVRNAEGGFYVCQAMQNVYKSSAKIRIRWLSQEKKDNKVTDVYTPDFYDLTDFDCILTNIELKRLDKNKYQLPEEEKDRTENILKRALDVEKGVAEKPSITEEHPDGLDLSLFRDESQLKKRKSAKKTPRKGETSEKSSEDSEDQDEEDSTEEPEEKKKEKPKVKASKKSGKTKSSKEKAKLQEKDASKRAERASEREKGRERSAAVKRKSDTASKPPPEKKAKPAPSKTPKKVDTPETATPSRSTKTRSAKSSAPTSSKTSPVTRTKERERRGSTTPTKERKKAGKKA